MRSQFVNIGEFTPANGIMRPYMANYLDADLLRDVETIRAYSASVNWRLTAVTAPNVMVSEEQLNAARWEQRFAGSLYHDLVATHDLPHGCQTVLASDGRAMTAMWTHRGQAAGATAPDELALFHAMAPDVLAAIRLEQAMSNQGATLVAGALEAMHTAAFILDKAGRMLAMTPTATALASRHAVIAVAGSALRALDRRSDDRLQAMIGDALRGRTSHPVVNRIWLRDQASPHGGLIADISSLPPRAWNFPFEPRVIVALHPPTGVDHAAAVPLLRQSFDLSLAEAEVAVALAGGHSRADVARARQVSLATINAQMKSIYRKTDVRREAELVALVVRLAR